MKKLQTILFALGVAFFSYLLWRIGVRELWRELVTLGWGLIPILLGEGIAEMIHTVGWRRCLSGPLRSLPWSVLFRIRMAGYAINYITPTAALGGEFTKAALLASRHRGPESASGVLIGKVCFALAHLIFVAFGALLVLWRVPLPRTLWIAMLACGALLAGGMAAFMLLQKFGHIGAIVRWLAARKFGGRPLQKFASDITAVDGAMKRFYADRPGDLPRAIGWHLVGYSVGIVQTWLFFHLLHLDTTWTMAAATWFLGMWFDLLTFAIPMNLGTLEGTRIVALKGLGYTAVTGMTYGVAIRMAQVAWSLFGLVNYALLNSAISQPPQPDCPARDDEPSLRCFPDAFPFSGPPVPEPARVRADDFSNGKEPGCD